MVKAAFYVKAVFYVRRRCTGGARKVWGRCVGGVQKVCPGVSLQLIRCAEGCHSN